MKDYKYKYEYKNEYEYEYNYNYKHKFKLWLGVTEVPAKCQPSTRMKNYKQFKDVKRGGIYAHRYDLLFKLLQ